MELLFEKWIKVLKNYRLIVFKDDSLKQKFAGTPFRLFFVEIMLILQIMYLKEVKDLLEFSALLNTLSTYISFFVKVINIIYYAKLIEELVQTLKTELDGYELTEKFQKRITSTRRIFISFWISAFVTTFFGGFVPFFSGKLAYKMWFPYDLNNPILFWISACYQHVATVIGSSLDAILEMQPVFFMAYVIAMLEQLCDELESLKKAAKKEAWRRTSSRPTSYNSKLIKIIDKHRNLIQITKKIEKIFNITFFVRGLTSTIVFCTTAFSLIVVDDMSVVMRLITYTIPTFGQLFIPCYYGNEISFYSDRLSTSLFHSEWYEENDKKITQLLMEFSRRKIKISTFEIFQVDLGTFMKVCNSAYSLYAVFKNIYR